MLPKKKQTEKPVGVGKKDLKKAKQERLAGSLGKGHPIIPVKQSDKVVNYLQDTKRVAGAGRDFPDTSVPRKNNKKVASTGPLDDLLVEKTGGKVSKYKGGKVGNKKKTKKTYGGHHGNKYVAKLYD